MISSVELHASSRNGASASNARRNPPAPNLDEKDWRQSRKRSRSWSAITAAVGSSTRTSTGTCAGTAGRRRNSSARSEHTRVRNLARRRAKCGFAERSAATPGLGRVDMDGQFARDPYWVEARGGRPDRLSPSARPAKATTSRRPAETPDSLLLQEGARPTTGAAFHFCPR